MDIHSEKLMLIEQLLRVNDIRIIEQIREALKKMTVAGFEPDGRPITQYDLIKKIELAEKEYASGKYISVEDLEKESESW